MENPLNDSKGCGGIMRVAPMGLFLPPDQAFEYGCRTAAITHGHPTGYLASGMLARIISEISYGADIIHAVDRSLDILKKQSGHEETLNAVNRATDAWKNAPVSSETVASLGQGWVAEETLAIGLYCALAADGDFDRGIRLAVNHSGDSVITSYSIHYTKLYDLEFPVNRCKPDIGYMIQFLELGHDLFANAPGRNFLFAAVPEFLFKFIQKRLNGVDADIPFFTGSLDSRPCLVP